MQERSYSKCKLDDLVAALGGFALAKERPTQKEQIKALFFKGRSSRQIADILGIPEKNIASQLSRLGLRHRPQNSWTQAEVRLLLQLRADGNTYKKISRIIQTHAPAACQIKYVKIQKSLRSALGSSLRAA